jgi:hypothetical protein
MNNTKGKVTGGQRHWLRFASNDTIARPSRIWLAAIEMSVVAAAAIAK